MSTSSFVQHSFLGGEYSPLAQGRSDTPDYVKAMNVCRNGMPLEEGAWVRRSGTRFAATTLNGAAGRVIPFAFAQSTPYYLEFTDGFLRMFAVAASLGQSKDFRLVTDSSADVASIATSGPCTVTTVAPHGWSSGKMVEFLFSNSNTANVLSSLVRRQFAITVTGTSTFTLPTPAVAWAPSFSGYVKVAGINIIATPWTSASWQTIRSVQAETQTFLLNVGISPYCLAVATMPTASSFATFTLAKASFTDGPYLDPPVDGSTLTPSAKTGTIHLTASSAASINGGAGFMASDVGRLVRIFSEPPAWAIGTTYAVGDPVKYSGAYFVATAASTGQQPDVSVGYWSISTTVAAWSWATIASIMSTVAVTATVSGADLLYTTAAAIWRLGVYSGTTWPTCGLYYEGRVWFAGAVLNRVDASVVNGISGAKIDMTPTAPDGTVGDANGISYTFNSKDVNPILWMIGTDQGIACGTLGREWLIQASQLSDPITPTSIQAHPRTSFGSQNIEAIHTDLTTCFVQRFGRKLLEYFPDVFSGRYNAPNLSRNAKHLTTSEIVEIRYQQELLPVIWARCGNGSLIGCTYRRNTLFSTQGPEFNGWHRHDLGSGRVVESIAVGPSANGTLDTLVMVTNDPQATNIRHVEILNNVFDVDDTILDGWFLDDAVVPAGGVIAVSGQGGNTSTLTLNGLWHLNGDTVTVWIAGIDCGDFLVSGGQVVVSIDNDPAGLLTSSYLASISSGSAYGLMACGIHGPQASYIVPCVVGFTYTSQGQCLRPDTAEQSRSPTGPGLGKIRNVQQFATLLQNTQGISFGTDFNALMDGNFKQKNGVSYSLLDLFSGVYWDTLNDDMSRDGMMCWQVTRPYPASVINIGGFGEWQEVNG